MWDWFARNLRHEWLGNLAWWPGAAAVVQAIFAVLLFWITMKYVRLTKKLVEAQIEPVIEVSLLGESSGTSPNCCIHLQNKGSIPVVQVRAIAQPYTRIHSGAYPRSKEGKGPVRAIYENLAPGQENAFVLTEAVDVLSAIRASEQPPVSFIQYEVRVEIKYQRKSDLRQFQQRKRLIVGWTPDEDTPFLSDADMFSS